MQNMIETQQLTKQFPARERLMGLLPSNHLLPPVVNQVDLQVAKGELFGLLGPNGAGKTTLIKMLCTLIQPTSGRAEIGGWNLGKPNRVRATIGLVTTDERSFYWRLSARQNLSFFATLQGIPADAQDERINTLLDLVGMQKHADRAVKNYSTGMRQRISIARALLHEPQVLFLDEPTKGLDPVAIRMLHDLIRHELTETKKITVFLTTHWLDEAESLCDRISVMHLGQIRGVGTVKEMRADLKAIGRYQIRVQGVDLAQVERIQPYIDGSIGKIIDGAGAVDEIDEVTVPETPGALDEAVDAIRHAGGSIRSIAYEELPLEEIFIALTGEQESAPTPRGLTVLKNSPQGILRFNLLGFAKGLPRVMWAYLKKDWQSEVSYRFSFLLQFTNIFITVPMFYFMSVVLGDGAKTTLAAYGGDYFAFVLIGMALMRYFTVGLSSFAKEIRLSQTTGTLEAMLTTSASFSSLILASSQWSYLMTTFQVLLQILLGLALGLDLTGGNYLGALVILILTIFSFSSIGVLAASFIMVLKRGDPVTALMGGVSSLLGGVYYPFEILPGWLRWISYFIPLTYSMRGMRLALLQDAGFVELLPDILALSGFAVILLPLSLAAFRYAVTRAQNDGTLTHY